MSLSGITGGAGVFISQFYGKKDVSNIRKSQVLLVYWQLF
ncbi:MATE efflux family domain protein [Clostridioides difficile CD42]|nr:MATE efflux family domain protein [Clostridioides difficile CD42]